MNHLSEEELIAHAYAEDGKNGVDKNGVDKNGVERHLAACAECAKAYAALRSDLSEMEFAEVPDRDAFHSKRVWESISGLLPAYEVRSRGWLSVGLWRGLGYAAACAALIAGTLLGGRLWERRQAQVVNHSQQKQQSVAHPAQRVVVVVLSDHLDRSERLLMELKHADSAEMVSPLRDKARSLLAANRICRQNAKQDDDPELAAALDRLDHLLAELANQPGDLTGASIARLQDQMNSDHLLFEVRVLRSRHASPSAQTKEGTI